MTTTTTAGRYRSKPVEVDAIQWTGENNLEVTAWLEAQQVYRLASTFIGNDQLAIHFGDGDIFARPGDWILHVGDDGIFRIVRPAEFAQCYEAERDPCDVLWNSDQIRARIAQVLHRSVGKALVDDLMDVVRDLMAQIAAGEYERAGSSRRVISRLQEMNADLRANLALHKDITRSAHDELVRLMLDNRPVRVTTEKGHVYDWTATIAGLADHPTVLLDCNDGKRQSLPQAFTYTEA